MTTTYDPQHPHYLDEADVRNELTRVFDVCQGCRRCVDRCSSFPTLFGLVDRFDDRDPGRLTPAEQDEVVDGCFQCKLCHLDCPYASPTHELSIDFPRLMLRAEAMRVDTGQVSIRSRATTKAIARTDAVGKLGSATAAFTNKVIGARQGSLVRKAVAAFTGVSSVRVLPPYAKQRFSTWFGRRTSTLTASAQRVVTVFPTCFVEYHEPSIGKDLVRVYERNGIDCRLTEAGCCGAPWLHAGDVKRFTKAAERNVETLAAEVRRGGDVVVPQPTCTYVLQRDYADYVGGPDAELVAAHVHDAGEFLMNLHRDPGGGLDTRFPGDVPATITYHAACHLRAQQIGLPARELLELTGASVTTVQQCSGTDGMWGLRAGNEQLAIPIAQRLGEQIDAAGNPVVAGDCALANTAITEQTGRVPFHPLSVLARAYGIADD